MVVEPGTGLFVHRSMSDGKWNRVDHPLNFPADTSEAISLPVRSVTDDDTPPFLVEEDGTLILDDNGQPIYIL
jgi:hypothetical protein